MTDIYTAGLFDGEGTVTLSKITASSKFRIPVVSISSTTKELIDFLKSNYGGSVSNHKTYKSHHKASWSWKLSYNNAIDFLERMIPYIKEPEKLRRASLIVNQYKKLTSPNGRYSPEEEIAKLEFEEVFFGISSKVSK